MTVYKDFTLNQGATFKRTLVYKDGSGNPIDLSAFDVRMQIRGEQSTDGYLALDLNSTNGLITVSEPTEGKVLINIDSETSSGILPKKFYYDVELFDQADPPNVIRMMQGRITVSPEVTD